MNRQVVYRAVVLVLIGFGFYGLTSVINLLAESGTNQQQEFSYIKRTADQHWDNDEFETAGRYYKELALADPHNGGAWYRYSQVANENVYNLTKKLQSTTDSEEVENLEAEIGVKAQEAIDAFEHTVKFTQFRNTSRFWLGLLYGATDRPEEGMEHLRDAIRDGWRPKSSRASRLFIQYGCESMMEEPELSELLSSKRNINSGY